MKLREIKLTPPIVAISAMLLVLTGAAAPKIVYVAPSGTGDGTSWESAMGSVSNAYASAAAFAESGCDSGEVWLKAGRYELFNDEAGKVLSEKGYIELRSKVTVRGGFAGGETDPSQADRDKNLTIISGDRSAGACWYPNGAKPATDLPMWTEDANGRRTVFNPPNEEGTDDYWQPYYANKVVHGTYGFASKVGGLEACRFFGLTFTSFSDNCIATLKGDDSTQPSTGLVVSNCNFYGCGADRTGNVKYGAVYAYDTDLIVCDCRFIGCTQGIMDLPVNVAAMGEIRDCTFEKGCSLPVQFGDKSKLKLNANCGIVIRDCQFNNNYSTWGASAIRFETTTNKEKSLVAVSNVVFRGNLSSGGAPAAVTGAPYNYSGSAGWHQFYDCDFVGNKRLKSASSVAVASCCTMNCAGKWFFKGCSFRDNVAEHAPTAAGAPAASAVCSRGNHGYIYFHDCTFCGNSVLQTGSAASVGTLVVDNPNQRLSVCSSVFTGNTVTQVDAESGVATRGADIVVRGMTDNNNFTLVNTILYDESPDYVALELYPAASGMYYFYKNYIKGFDSADWPDVKFSKCAEITTSGDLWLREPKKGPGAAYAVGLVTGPKCLRHGADTRLAGYDTERKDGSILYRIVVAIRDEALSKTKPWQTLQSAFGLTATWSDADAPSYGLSKDDPLMPDAFGNPRTAGKMAYGPLNAPDLGLMLLLR